MSRQRVKTGLDLIRANPEKYLGSGARVGLLVNQATVDGELNHAIDIFRAMPNIELRALFAPEHGLWGARQDMATVAHEHDPRTGLPIWSLYGATEETLAPSSDSLAQLDCLVIDLPDIGTRYYTFAQTALYCLRVAKRVGVRVVLLDRPNPLGGDQIEGPGLTAACRSFCGYAPVPPRHGLTLGELVVAMNNGMGEGTTSAIPAVGADMTVVPVEGWDRRQYFDETGLPWVLPSPNMPTLETAIVYPGACLIEGTTLSEGRGTTRPFEFLGAPGIDPWSWVDCVERQGIPLAGAKLRAHVFEPGFQKHAKASCFGVQLHITDRRAFQSIRWYLALFGALRDSHRELLPNALEWRTHAYEFVNTVPAIDLLWGSDELRTTLDEGKPVARLLPSLEANEAAYRATLPSLQLYKS